MKFSKADGVDDQLADQIGDLSRKIRSQPHWNSDAAKLNEQLVSTLEKQKYRYFLANVTNYGTWQTGESKFFYVPETRRVALSFFRGKIIRLICIHSGRFTRGLMAKELKLSIQLKIEVLEKKVIKFNLHFVLDFIILCPSCITL